MSKPTAESPLIAPAGHMPCVEELHAAPDAEVVFRRLARLPHVVYFDSARQDPHLGRYSFIAADPFAWLERPVGSTGSFDLVRRAMKQFVSQTVDGLPPFQGGAAGLFSYELGRELERYPAHRRDEFALPVLAVGLYDVVVAFDHLFGRCWIVSQGFPEQDPARRRQRAEARLEQFRRQIAGESAATPASRRQVQPPPATNSAITLAQLVPQHSVGPHRGVTSDFSRAEFTAAIARAIEYVHAGDLFQVNLAQRLLHPATDDSLELYSRMRRRNSATFAGYLDLGEYQLVSASPERFLQVRNRMVETRPIKGTRRRPITPEAEMYTAEDLRESQKDAAENVMIVDLLRNDLSRVCRPESVCVTQLCQVETYEFVQHLVSAVVGELREGLSSLDALEAAFPGGSVTGAPKIRAMEIIAELERSARGAYCGSLAYVGFDGALDASILIRTITAGRGWWQFPVGGGIVADSHVDREYEETWHKAEGILRSLLP